MLSFLTMARLPETEARELIAGFARAFRQAMAADGLTLKEVAYLTAWDAAQIERGLSGEQAFDVRRLARLVLRRPSFGARLVPLLTDEWGGLEGCLALGILRALTPFFAGAGQARMVHATLSCPRMQEGVRCDGDSRRQSA